MCAIRRGDGRERVEFRFSRELLQLAAWPPRPERIEIDIDKAKHACRLRQVDEGGRRVSRGWGVYVRTVNWPWLVAPHKATAIEHTIDGDTIVAKLPPWSRPDPYAALPPPPGQCHFISGSFRDGDGEWCGKRTARGVYCAEHTALCYLKPGEKR